MESAVRRQGPGGDAVLRRPYTHASGLDGLLELAHGQTQRGPHLGVARAEHGLVDVIEGELPRNGAQRLRADRITNRVEGSISGGGFDDALVAPHGLLQALACWLARNNADRWLDAFGSGGDAAYQAAAAHRHENGVQRWNLLEHLQADGALASGN